MTVLSIEEQTLTITSTNAEVTATLTGSPDTDDCIL